MGDVRLHADDGLYALLAAGVIEIYHAVHYAVIGYGERIETELISAVDKIAYSGGAVQKAVFRMNVKMREAHSSSPFLVFSLRISAAKADILLSL